MYSITLLAMTTLAGLASAQSTTSLFLPMADEQPLIASVVASDKTATTYLLACPPGTDSDECGFSTGMLFTQGPATMAYTIATNLGIDAGTTEILFTATIQCSLASVSAVCTASLGGSEADDRGIETTTVTGTDYTFAKVTLTNSIAPAQTIGPQTRSATTSASSVKATASSTLVTSGTAKTGSASGAAVAQSTGSASGTAASGSASQSGSASGTAASQSSGSAAPSSSSSQAGAQAMFTARPQAWIVGGAAVAWALL